MLPPSLVLLTPSWKVLGDLGVDSGKVGLGWQGILMGSFLPRRSLGISHNPGNLWAPSGVHRIGFLSPIYVKLRGYLKDRTQQLGCKFGACVFKNTLPKENGYFLQREKWAL